MLDATARELDNFRLALGWCLETDVAKGLHLVRRLNLLWIFRGLESEGRRWYEAFLARTSERSVERGLALWRSAWIAWEQGDFAAARAEAEETSALARELQSWRVLGQALHLLGMIAASTGDHELALHFCDEARGAFLRAGIDEDIPPKRERASVIWRTGERAGARRTVEEYLSARRARGELNELGWSLFDLAGLALDEGNAEGARQLLGESLTTFRECGDEPGTASALSDLGFVLALGGEDRRAVPLLHEGLVRLRQTGQRPRMARALARRAVLAARDADFARAAVLAGAAHSVDAYVGVATDPPTRRAMDEALTAMKAQLGEQAFAHAFATGQEMSVEQAVNFGLGETSLESGT
jgi:tetratricopeptide (TPR) repeat protein